MKKDKMKCAWTCGNPMPPMPPLEQRQREYQDMLSKLSPEERAQYEILDHQCDMRILKKKVIIGICIVAVIIFLVVKCF